MTPRIPDPHPQLHPAEPARPRRRRRRRLPDAGLRLAIAVTSVVLALPARLWQRGHREDGSPTVETIGWVSFALFIVLLLGGILRNRLTTFANALPTSLNW